MRIGMLSHWYDPEGGAAAGPGTIARELRDRGHDVHVVTGYPIYPAGKVFPGYSQRPYLRELLDGVTVHRAPIYPSHDDRAAHRMANYLSFAASGSVTASAVLGGMDVAFVYSTPATAATPALALKALRRVPFVVQVQDLWPQTVTSSDFVASAKASSMERVLHQYCDQVYRSAHSIAVTSPGMAPLIADRGISTDRIHFVPNWAEESSFYPMERSAHLAEELGVDDRFTVMYAGNLGEMQDLPVVIDAAEMLANETDIRLVLVGSGTMERALRTAVVAKGLDNVHFTGPQPFSRMAEILSLGDVQLVILKDKPLFRSTLPSKLQANLAAGRPVIAAVAGDAADVVRSSDAGLVSPPGDASALATAIRALHAEGRAANQERGDRARRYYLEHFSTQSVGNRLEDLLLDAARGAGR